MLIFCFRFLPFHWRWIKFCTTKLQIVVVFVLQAFVKAVTSGVENVEAILLSDDYQKQLVPTGPRLIANKTKSFKTIDSEDVLKRSLAQEDGKIITEQKKTTEHEIIVDDEQSDDGDDNDQSLGSQERIKTIVSSFSSIVHRYVEHAR